MLKTQKYEIFKYSETTGELRAIIKCPKLARKLNRELNYSCYLENTRFSQGEEPLFRVPQGKVATLRAVLKIPSKLALS